MLDTAIKEYEIIFSQLFDLIVDKCKILSVNSYEFVVEDPLHRMCRFGALLEFSPICPLFQCNRKLARHVDVAN